MFGKYGTFAGGIALPDQKQATLDLPIKPCPPLRRLLVPLDLGAGRASLVVGKGRRVSAGELLARGTGGGSDVLAPVSGVVVSTAKAMRAGVDAMVPCDALEIEPAAPPAGPGAAGPIFDWRGMTPLQLRHRLGQGGLCTHSRPITPLAAWIEQVLAAKCRTLLCNVLETEPYVTSGHRLLVEHGSDVIRGLALLSRAMDIEQATLVVDERRTDDYRALVGPSRLYGIARVALSHKYPGSNEAILVRMLTRREVPINRTSMSLGVAVVSASTCLAVWRWGACGLPDTGRCVTVAGERAAECGNYWAPYGARCADLTGAGAELLVHNSPLVGLRCRGDCVVTPASEAVLALDAQRLDPPGSCIRCGWCTDRCPARLNVAALNDAFELGMVAQARRLGAAACIECGVCSYLCPSRLPLSQRVRELKRAAADLSLAQRLAKGGPK
jgi:electron transport complex protein RnfC